METNVIVTLVNVTILVLTYFVSTRRAKAQNIVDDSTAASKFRQMLIDMQAEIEVKEEKQKKKDEEQKKIIEDLRKDIQRLNDRLDNSRLYLNLSMSNGKEPKIESWVWADGPFDQVGEND